ncbi:MAG: response regulator [Endomicrobiia bacterium]
MTTILIIEDDVDLAELILERLKDEGYDTSVVYSGKEAIRKVIEQKPDCITLDVHLPDMSGIEILREIKGSIDKNLPVIVVTSDDAMRNECEKYNPEGFFKKPIDFKQLKKLIKVTIDKKQKK